ncbi:Farnesyl diphosphate synthase [Candidatus Profftia lariciata]|uniref:(2E,6E)-farnesyl diphosphate synthase n=1 Tax=Candidatus Profftia lariciata TaxID=1987921 RepID=UPI001D004AEE|nr:(2E,6E)-farnesyl diphosphate synthase [Candidatus Profftia lariciata]UDG81729.1 Farnesyl diphosphate synthase [Candidatus Profftia lariciata]
MIILEKLFKKYHQRADSAIIKCIKLLPFAKSLLVAAMFHNALPGGKRLRPYLVYATGEMFGLSLDVLDVPATAIECMHAYSLIHDDLPAIDDDNIRRGRPTTHIKFGEAHAILAGNAFQSLAFSILADSPMPAVSDSARIAMLSELAKASGVAGMCSGQALDLENEGKNINLLVLEKIHKHKTGALIRCAILMSVLASGKYAHTAIPFLEKYALAIGLAFQVRDDILDVIGNSRQTGKTQGSDQKREKNTYPALLGLKKAQNKAKDLYNDAIHALEELEQHCSINTIALKYLASFIIKRNN